MAIPALLLGCAMSAASEPERAGAGSLAGYEAEAVGPADQIGARIGPEGLIAAWLGVFAALSALYAYERRHLPFAAAGLTAKRWSAAARQETPREMGKSGSREPRPAMAPAEASARRGGIGLGATQSGEETFRVADDDALGRPPVEAAERAVAPVMAPAAPTDDVQAESPTAPTPPTPDLAARDANGHRPDLGVQRREGSASALATLAPVVSAQSAPTVSQQAPQEAIDGPDVVRFCAALRSQGRFAEAARLARYGLADTGGDPGALLVELSRAELGLGRVNLAIDIARDAYFASRSRESVVHLIRLLTETRRFAREDGPSLRRAARRHPCQPLLLHAAGVFESMHGRPCDAERWLRAALPLAPDEGLRRAIAGELSRVEESRAREV